MHELRKDPVIGRWVIIASERSRRPNDYTVNRQFPSGGSCPFCYGSEDKTPPEVLAYRKPGQAPDSPGWRVRVVPNKYPALRIEGPLGRRAAGIYDMMNAVGAHEVVIESPDHTAQLADLAEAQIEEVLWAYHDRFTDLKKDTRFRYILIFKNQGADAGATLEHSHTQIIATPVVPKRATEEMQGARQHYDLRERCIYCDIIHQELEAQARVVAQNDFFLVLEPFAARFPFETWVLPIRHSAHFEDLQKQEVEALAAILRSTLRRIKVALEEPPYNYVLHTAPTRGDGVQEYYHWHLEIMPKLTKVAGFEWGSGFYINPTPPEMAAEMLRAAAIDAPALQDRKEPA
jgi:UDPglucose--hexose-1-phosphate uridylyltransferase